MNPKITLDHVAILFWPLSVCLKMRNGANRDGAIAIKRMLGRNSEVSSRLGGTLRNWSKAYEKADFHRSLYDYPESRNGLHASKLRGCYPYSLQPVFQT
jgi:hypothetical protein